MLMKKITFNAPLNHKAYSYEPMQHEVENAAFSDDKDMDETEDVDMTM